MVAIRTQTGKANFIRIRIPGSGEEKEVCICKENIDLSTRGCTSNINGRLLGEVMANQGTYAPGNLKRYRAEGLVDQGCAYCYAGWKNKGNVYPKTIDRKTKEQFRAMRPLSPIGMSGIQEKI